MTTATKIKTAPAKKIKPGMSKKGAGKPKTKKQAVAFANWIVVPKSIVKKTITKEETAREFRGGKGWAIHQNPEYPNPQEDKLVELAKSQGGTVELLMRVTITLNEQGTKIADTDMSQFI